MNNLTEISLSITRNDQLRRPSGMLTFGYGGVSFPSVCFKVYRQGWNKAWIKGIKPEQWFVVQPRWINDEDDSKATILALKVYVAWHQDIGREFKLDPSNIVVF